MTTTQIVIFILVVAGNGLMALWKKHKDRQAALAASKLVRSAGGAKEIDERIAARQALRVRAQQPPVMPSTSPPPAAHSEAVSFEDVVRIEMRRLAAMRAVLDAAGSSEAAGQLGQRDAADAPVRDVAPGLAIAVESTPRVRRLLSGITLRNAILAREVLGPPRSSRPWAGTTS